MRNSLTSEEVTKKFSDLSEDVTEKLTDLSEEVTKKSTDLSEEGWRAVAQWLRHCATNRKVAGSIPDGVIGIFH
jgi:hypothetical protein